MSKYDPLRIFLENAAKGVSEMTLTFQQIETILGFTLPPSARRHRAWWANPGTPHDHPHAQAWLAAGWKVDTVNQHREWVRFRLDMGDPTTDREVIVWDLDHVPDYELFFELAKGYIHAASIIFEEQRDTDEPNYFNLRPGFFALGHGIELFLKGAILLGDSSVDISTLARPRFGHDLEALYNKYLQVYDPDRFELYDRINDLIKWRQAIDQSGLDARYPFNREGEVWRRSGWINIDFSLAIICEFAQDLQRLELEIKECTGVPTAIPMDHRVQRVQRSWELPP
jgi:hypothetical protein